MCYDVAGLSVEIVTVSFCITFYGVGDRLARKYLSMYNHMIMYRCMVGVSRDFM